MLGFKKKHFWATVLLSALISPFIFFSSSMKPWSHSGWASTNLLQEILYPIESTWTHVTSGVSSAWNTYFSLSNAALENQELKKHLALLEVKMMDYQHQAQEVDRLRKLLGFSQKFEKKMLVAEVLGNSTDSPFQSMRIARGHKDQARVGMPVVAAHGIVGRILRTGLHFSDIQLLVDANFNLDVIVERTRVRGVLNGLVDNRCRLKLHRRADIRIGDTIVTSGITGSFPKGLPVGRVIRISYETDNVSQVITIQPWVDYHRLEEVVVLKHSDQQIETIKETAGQEWISSPPFSKAGPGA